MSPKLSAEQLMDIATLPMFDQPPRTALLDQLLAEHAAQAARIEELEGECAVLRECRNADLAYLPSYKTHDEELIAWKRLRAAVDALDAHDQARARRAKGE